VDHLVKIPWATSLPEIIDALLPFSELGIGILNGYQESEPDFVEMKDFSYVGDYRVGLFKCH